MHFKYDIPEKTIKNNKSNQNIEKKTVKYEGCFKVFDEVFNVWNY